MGAINISSVGKIYPNGTRALEDVNIEINDGEFVVLVGPSGCGKTTLLRMVAGLEDITEGEISIADKIVNEVAPKDRDIAMVFQNYALYPHMSVYDNMAFSLKLRKLSKEEIDELGWSYDPFEGHKVLKADYNYYFNADKDLTELKLKLEYLQECIDVLKDILNILTWRHQSIKNAIDWLKFTNPAG